MKVIVIVYLIESNYLTLKGESLLLKNALVHWLKIHISNVKRKLFKDKCLTSSISNYLIVANFFQPRKDSNALFDREEEIIPTNIQPLGDVACMKHTYEKALTPEKPPTPRRASGNLTREDWDQIREELLEESCNRNALRSEKKLF